MENTNKLDVVHILGTKLEGGKTVGQIIATWICGKPAERHDAEEILTELYDNPKFGREKMIPAIAAVCKLIINS